MKISRFVLMITWLLVLAWTIASPAAGPLRVHPDNPRYFTDDTGRAIYLTGAHTWRTVQDAGTDFPPTAFDFSEFLDLVGKHHHNFVRLWAFESSAWVRPDSTILWLDPLPFERTGPGNGCRRPAEVRRHEVQSGIF